MKMIHGQGYLTKLNNEKLKIKVCCAPPLAGLKVGSREKTCDFFLVCLLGPPGGNTGATDNN